MMSSQDYNYTSKELKEIFSAFEVVNDCAERTIKMITHFKDATANVEEQGYLLQVLEDYI